MTEHRQAQVIQKAVKSPLPKDMVVSLIILQSLNVLTLVKELALWFIALLSLCFVWRLAVYLTFVPNLTRIGKLFVSLSGCLLLVLTGKQLGLLLGMVHLLCFAYTLKPFELNCRRDLYQVFVLGLLVLAMALVFQQSVYFSVVIALLLWFNIAWLIALFSDKYKISHQAKPAGLMLVQSLPLAIVLFILFPKIPPFWQMPSANSAKTGLSDEVAIGDISNLALSNELAFRVEFEGPAPEYHQMYWRAIVLENFDGTHWRRQEKSSIVNTSLFAHRLARRAEGGRVLNYQVIAEPTFQTWLFGLDILSLSSGRLNQNVELLPDYSLVNKDKMTQVFPYALTSYLDQSLTIHPLSADDTWQFNSANNPKLNQYAKQLRRQHHDDEQLFQSVLRRFSQQPYRYTLTPPAIANHSLDEFFFSSQAGFCEHYASSFTYIMRAAGIPARVVVGYLGGEYNTQGGYYSVYQRDAHAWSEVWLEDRGWVRVDPTSAVDPSRVERGFSQQLLSEQQAFSTGFNFPSSMLFSYLRMQFEALDYQWTKFVVHYSKEQQHKVLSDWLGENIHYKSALIIFAGFFAGILCIWLWLTYGGQRLKRTLWQQYLFKAHKYLKTFNLEKSNQMSYQEFQKNVSRFDVELGKRYGAVLTSYQQLEYQRTSEEQKIKTSKRMKQQLNALRQIKPN